MDGRWPHPAANDARRVEDGITEASFNACLADKQLFDRVVQALDRASAFGVGSAPTFFVNGEKHVGFATIGEMTKLIAAHLKD
jgi:protein-disulfide isomerase